MKSLRKMLAGINHEDLRQWAGSKIFNRGKDYVPCVAQLSRTEHGTLVAWVSGTDEYATSVRYEGLDEFDYDCTCPYDDWGPCKHVVAVLLAAAGELKKNREIPLLDPEDDLYLEAFEEDDYDWVDEEEDQAQDDKCVRLAKKTSSEFEKLLNEKSRDELQTLLIELALDYPDVSRRLRDTARLETGQVDKLVRSLRKEIRNLTGQDAWFNHWKHEGNLPDYFHVGEQLQALLDKGHADAVFELGQELWERGSSQVEESDDEGETALAIAGCLDIVLRAVSSTKRSPVEQLLWLVEHELNDEFGLLSGAEAVMNDPRYTQEHWRDVAETLENWLQEMGIPKNSCFSSTYRREQVMTRLRNAYSRSGETQKVIPLLEQEADRCRSYKTLVSALLESGERERARQWCIKGFNKTLKDAPGIARDLQELLRQMAEDDGKLDLVLAYRAEDFFNRPSEQAYLELRQAAEKIEVWPAVRKGALGFLQTGKRPAVGSLGKNAWPLPEPEVKKSEPKEKLRMVSFPHREMLIEIAILEQRHDDAVALYQEFAKTRRWGWGIDEQLAKAVAASHPDVALQIWQTIAERLIGQVKPKAYQEAAGYLRKMKKVYERTGRLVEWKTLILRLRTQHKAKRRLMEVLDGLENDRKLID